MCLHTHRELIGTLPEEWYWDWAWKKPSLSCLTLVSNTVEPPKKKIYDKKKERKQNRKSG